MPYIIRPSTEKGESGFKVCKKDNTRKCFSKHPLSNEMAQKQRTAIILSEKAPYRYLGGETRQLHTGPRGGKYVIVNGAKRYVQN